MQNFFISCNADVFLIAVHFCGNKNIG